MYIGKHPTWFPFAIKYIYQKAIVGLVILLSLCVCVKDGQDAMICYSNDYV